MPLIKKRLLQSCFALLCFKYRPIADHHTSQIEGECIMSPSGEPTWEVRGRFGVRVCRSGPSSVLQTTLHYTTRPSEIFSRAWTRCPTFQQCILWQVCLVSPVILHINLVGICQVSRNTTPHDSYCCSVSGGCVATVC